MSATKTRNQRDYLHRPLEKGLRRPVKSNPGSGTGRQDGNRNGASLTQRRNALRNANRNRLARAGIKRGLKARTLTLSEAFEHEAASGIPIYELLESIPYLTPAKIGTILLIARIGYARPTGRLRPRDRWAILHLLTERHPGIKVRP